MTKRKSIYMYKNHPSMKTYFCFYCGNYGEGKDHVPAVSYAEFFNEYDRILVRCCITCNSLLSNKPFNTLLSRCEFLLQRYLKKYKKLLSSPNWSDYEIDELKGSLKSKIIIMMKNKKFIEEKIKNLTNNIDVLIEKLRNDE